MNTSNQYKEHPVNNQKGFLPIILGVLVLLIVVGGGAYYLGTENNGTTNQTVQQKTSTITNPINSPTITENTTNNWKTLTNTRFGYSFRYPSDKYNETINTTEPYLYAVQYCPTKKPEDCAFPSNVFQVIAYDNSQNMDIENWLKTSDKSTIYQQGKLACQYNDPRTVQSTEDFLGQTVTTYKFTMDQETAEGVCKGVPLEGGGKYKYIFAEKGNKIYWISISTASKEVYPELEQILYTFQFTN